MSGEGSFILKEKKDIPTKLNNKRGDKTHLLLKSRFLFLFKSDQCIKDTQTEIFVELLGQICICFKCEEACHPNHHHFMMLYIPFHQAISEESRFHSCFTGGEIKAGDFPKVPQEARERAGRRSRTLCLFIVSGMRSCFKSRDRSASFHFLRFIDLLVCR